MESMRDSIKKILQEGDLALLSAKKVRQRLEVIYGEDLTEKKKEIDAMLMEALEEMEKVDDQNLSSIDTNMPSSTAANSKRANSPVSDSSSQISINDNGSFASDDENEKSKKKKTKILPNTIDKGSGDSEGPLENDEELARKMQAEESASLRTRRSTKQKYAKTQQKKRKKADGENGDKKRKATGYSRPCHLSPLLADVMGTDQMARKDVVKRMWEIIKERNLQDPKNKQFALCDEQLTKVFGRKKIRTFGMMKYLSHQIREAVD